MTRVWMMACIVLAAGFCGAPAVAHVTLEQRQAAPGAPYKAVFRVPHGCGGSDTVRLSVTIPEGIILVKPMAKPSWQIAIVRGPYSKPFASLHGAKMTEGVKEVTWTGRLPDTLYDEFIVTSLVSSDLVVGSTLYFPVVQTCEHGEHRWLQLPAQSTPVDEPAPSLRIIAPSNRPNEDQQ